MIDLKSFASRHRARFGGEPKLFAAPGRVNIIGEHTDYNEGFVLPMAIDRHTVVAVSRDDTRLLRVYSEAYGESHSIELDRPFARTGAWIDYVVGVVEAVARERNIAHGGAISIGGDLPLGAGISSSAALELAIGLAVYDLAGENPQPRQLAAAGATAEHDYVGIRSGVMDQLICALGQPEHVLLIDCRSLEVEPVRLPRGVSIAVCDTRVKHALAGSAYNERRAACERGVEILRSNGLNIRSLRDVTVEQFVTVQRHLPHPVLERCRHVIEENHRTLEAVDALASGDLQRLGALLNESHRSLRDLYQVSCPELDRVADLAQQTRGVYGARMTGGGFGGCVVAILEPEYVDDLRARLVEGYYAPAGLEPSVWIVRASGGASPVFE